MDPRRLPAACLLLSLVAAAPGCGRHEKASPAPATAEQAAAALSDARREVEARRARVAETKRANEAAEAQKQSAEEAAEKAAEAYEQASNALRDAEQKLAALVPPPPSDEEIFRRVQKQLLEAPVLAKVAIKAEVSARNVTLQGTVPDEETRDAAVSIARSVDGVASVESKIRVGAP